MLFLNIYIVSKYDLKYASCYATLSSNINPPPFPPPAIFFHLFILLFLCFEFQSSCTLSPCTNPFLCPLFCQKVQNALSSIFSWAFRKIVSWLDLKCTMEYSVILRGFLETEPRADTQFFIIFSFYTWYLLYSKNILF